MSNPYIGEIRCFGFNFAPAGWQLCNGALLPISQFEALFNLIGTTYGGDGQNTFAVPDLRGRVPIHQGTGSTGITTIIGEIQGVESVPLKSEAKSPYTPISSPARSWPLEASTSTSPHRPPAPTSDRQHPIRPTTRRRRSTPRSPTLPSGPAALRYHMKTGSLFW